MASWPGAAAARVPPSPSGLGWPASRQRAPSSSLTYTRLTVCPVYPSPVHKMASPVAEVTATDGAWSDARHGTGFTVRPRWSGRSTMTSVATTTAATPAWVAIRSSGSISRTAATLATAVQTPPLSGRLARKPYRGQPLSTRHAATSASTRPGTTARDSTMPFGVLTRSHRAPPSAVSHSPSPNTNPCSGVAKRMPHTAPRCPGAPTGTAGAGTAVQLPPRFRAPAIEVHGACAHGAVPSTNSSSGDTQVTDVAANAEKLDTERAVVLAAGLADPAACCAGTEPHPAIPMAATAASTLAQRMPPPPRR